MLAAGIEVSGGASIKSRRICGCGAAGAVTGAEAWSENGAVTGGGAERSGAPGHGAQLAGEQAEPGGEGFLSGEATVSIRFGSSESSGAASFALEQETSAAGAGGLRTEAALTLLILNHHAQLLEMPAEEFEESEA
jgi:hypothetical protein